LIIFLAAEVVVPQSGLTRVVLSQVSDNWPDESWRSDRMKAVQCREFEILTLVSEMRIHLNVNFD